MDKIQIASESNLRKIIRILVGLMDSQQTLEQQCVLPYVSDGSKTYVSPMLTIYNNGTTYGLYMCKYTTSGTWNPNSWIEICSVEVNELSAADIDAYMNGVSQTTWDYFKNIINDTAVSTTKTWSSSKTYSEVQEAYADAIAYTVKYVAKAKLITYKKVTSTADVTDESTLYLVPDASNNYAIYVLDSTTGSPLKLSDTSISLDDYYTKTETDAKYETKTDVAATYKDIASYGTEQGTLSFTNNKTTVTDAVNENTRLINTVDGKFSSKQDKLTFDPQPVSGSSNPVTSGGVYTAIANTDKNVGHVGAIKGTNGTIVDYTYTAAQGPWQTLVSFKVDKPGIYFVSGSVYYYAHDVSTNDCSSNFSLRLSADGAGVTILSSEEKESVSSCLHSSNYNVGKVKEIVEVTDANTSITIDMYCPTAAQSTTGIKMHAGYSAVKIG